MAELAKVTYQAVRKNETTKKNDLLWSKTADGKMDKKNPVLEKEYTVVTDTSLGKLMLKYASAIGVDDYAKDINDLHSMIEKNVRVQLVYIEKGKVTIACNRETFLTILKNRLFECMSIVGASAVAKEETYGDAME